jgi:hypothetical protein
VGGQEVAPPQSGGVEKTADILMDICNEFGLKARLAAALGGRYAYIRMFIEDRRLRKGWTFEPPTF